MLFVSVNQLSYSIPHVIDGVELRLDLFPTWNLTDIAKILSKSSHPIMITLRKTAHRSEEEREAKILQLLALKPSFIDLEYDTSKSFLDKVLHSTDTRVILSYHNFQETPRNLDLILDTMSVYPAYQYKIAAKALSTNDALRMLLFARKHNHVSTICMGEKGSFARVLGPVSGNVLNYAAIDEKNQTAPGQLSIEELVNIYRYPRLNRQTALYGLIGNPVNNSQGHIYHNAVFAKKNLNAVYVKMGVTQEELPEFFTLAKEIGFQGLSVTMPLKESVLPFVDKIDSQAKQIGAVNTLLFKQGLILGTNTDGTGALDAIEKKGPVRQKNIVLLGAGGAARAIAFEAKKRKANIWILNRTEKKAQELANALDCQAGSLSEIPSSCDILINCSPDGSTVDLSQLQPNTQIMDIVYVPKETPFLQKATQLGLPIIYGEEMFLNQAAAQTNFWNNIHITIEKMPISSLSTSVYLGCHLLKGTLLPSLCPGKSIIITDSVLQELYGNTLAKLLNAELICIPSGEKAKTKQTQEFLENTLFTMGADRNTTLIALGGGATTDVVGFVASIYLRGVPLILIPTTLLGMVDAAIGGKTAINTAFGKNLIGTIYSPKAIIADLETLNTLPEKEWMNGFAEILKLGAVFDISIWKLAQKNIRDQRLILKAIQGKIAVIEKDLREQSLRRILNFGHTIGHGLEIISQYQMPHGEAVALGCLVESHLSMCLGYLSTEDFEQIKILYSSFSFQLPKNYTRESLFQAMSHDKKRELGQIRFVLIDQIGHAMAFDELYCRPVSHKELESTLLWMEKQYG